jgi:hypothetical protein
VSGNGSHTGGPELELKYRADTDGWKRVVRNCEKLRKDEPKPGFRTVMITFHRGRYRTRYLNQEEADE